MAKIDGFAAQKQAFAVACALMRTGFRGTCHGARCEARVAHEKKRKTASLVGYRFLLEATPGFGPGVEVLQTFASVNLGLVKTFDIAMFFIPLGI
jgi:hypothetical protein